LLVSLATLQTALGAKCIVHYWWWHYHDDDDDDNDKINKTKTIPRTDPETSTSLTRKSVNG
jgi:hypothetical protein